MPDDLKTAKYGAINVSLAILWSNPNQEFSNRDSGSAIVGDATWAGGLSEAERLGLVDQVETTAIFGERVVILERRGDWYRVAAISQRTAKEPRGYPGWVLANQVSRDPAFLAAQLNRPAAVVAVPRAALCGDSSLQEPLGELSYQTRLPILGEEANRMEVLLPDGGSGYLARRDIKKTTELSFSGQAMIREAQWFLDLPYLWGGTSSYGFDCSGFMFRLYQSQGLSIPRDAAEQALEGRPVCKEGLRPGDLLFFAYSTDHPHRPHQIHHVALFTGADRMIHSPNSKSRIRSESFETGIYGAEYWGARRYAAAGQFNAAPEN